MGEYKMLNPKCKLSMHIGYGIIYCALLTIIYGIYWYINSNYCEYGFLEYILIIIAVVALIYIAIAPPIYYRHYRYMVTNEKIDIRRGIIILRRILVPIERIHQVEITRGPINNALGLADIEVTTAGGTVTIEFLDNDEAERIAETLNEFIRSMIKDRSNSLEQQ